MSIIRSFSLHTHSTSWSCSQAISEPVWHTPMLCVCSEKLLMMDTGSLKHVEFYSKNKFEKLVHLVGFIIRIDQFSITVCHLSQDTVPQQSGTTTCRTGQGLLQRLSHRLMKTNLKTCSSPMAGGTVYLPEHILAFYRLNVFCLI